ncbi:MAG: tetratricopeptide repeat protein [Thiomicrospira sp.]|uniref:tetratricopeptide repeat protein n=1 Tax=Thiomicrospira sp. TaxID=935 RepID=UPI0019EE5027|nr:tetratricopeptide repeat protein [Thiomicrospira sp.]MBE0493625.1 tetratricopeptide repeat protein [Thiomicrospira sp.]
MKLIGRVFLGVCVLSLMGCGQLQTKSTPVSQADSANSTVNKTPKTKLDPATMFEIMMGEMLAQKGDLISAYNLIYASAKNTRDPALAERAFQLAMSAFYAEGIDKSARLWREMNPQDPTPWRVGYIMALRQGELNDALEFWHAYRKRSDLSLEDDLRNSAAQVVQSTPPETGVAFFKALYQLYPNEWAAGYSYGYAADQYGRVDLAVEVLEEVVDQHQAPAEVYYALANLYVENDLFKRGLTKLASYVKSHPKDWMMQERYARLEAKASLYNQAKQRYARIVEANPNAYTSKLSLALLELEQGDLAVAKQQLETLLKIEGYQDVSHYYLGVVAKNQGDYVQARSHLERVVHPNYQLDANLLISQILFETRSLDAALQYLDQLQPSDDQEQVKILRARGIFYGQSGEWASAADQYRLALELSIERLTLSYSLAMALYELGAYDEYEQIIKEVLKDHPDEPDALNALGFYYVEQNRQLDEAARLLNRALELAPNSYHIIDSLAWLAYKEQRYTEAEKYIEQAWSLNQNDEVLIHMIKIKWALKKYNQAQTLWEKHHKQFPDNPILPDLMKQLKTK